MGATMGTMTEQATVIFLFSTIAEKHGIKAEFDLSDPYNPKVNFIGGTEEQQEALALELADKFDEV